MKLSMLPIVQRTDMARRRAAADLDLVTNDRFVLMIDGVPQDDAMKAAIKAALFSELRGRIASLDRDLESYGVSVSA